MTAKVTSPVLFKTNSKTFLLCAGLLAMGSSRLAHAADFPVTNLNDSGAGSLRQAITDANNNAGADTISFANGLTGAIQLTSGELTISDNVTITGPGASALSVNAGGLSRHVTLATGKSATISGLKFLNGKSTTAAGGSIVLAGVGSALTLSKCILTGNQSTGAFTAGNGGAIFNNGGNLTATDCELTNNIAGYGGGAIESSGQLNLTRCTISGNKASGTYSGIGGGGIELSGALNSLTQCTISGNTSESEGGGIRLGGGATIDNCTITDNIAGVTLASGKGGGFYGSPVEVTIKNTIIAGNKKTPTSVNNDVDLGSNPIFSGDHNLIGTNSASFTIATIGNNSNQVGTPANPIDPKLSVLQNNGGLTSTRVPLTGSPAIDAGATTSVLTNDQRGTPFPRKVGAALDIGATEGDFTGPTAALTPIANITDSSTLTELLFTVVYTDETAVVRSSLGDTDIRVTGPNSFSALATLVSTTPTGDAASISAVYRLVPPGGTWDVADNGVYSVSVEANQVFDGGANPVTAGVLGYIMVGLNGSGSTPAISATPNGGGTFNFALNFPNPPTIPLTITVDYGDGTTGALGSHTYAQPGQYTVTVTVTGQGTPLTFTSTVSASQAGGGNFRVRVSKIRLDSSKTDTVALTGVITVPSNLAYDGKTIVVNVGGATQTFTLDASGKNKIANGSVAVNLPKNNKKNPAAAQQISFKATYTGAFAAAIKANTPVDTAGLPTSLPVTVLFNGQTYRQTLTVKFKAGPKVTTTRFGFF